VDTSLSPPSGENSSIFKNIAKEVETPCPSTRLLADTYYQDIKPALFPPMRKLRGDVANKLPPSVSI
jgi:hypothetical protein